MMQKNKYIVLFLSIVLFTQCEVEYKDFKPSNGEADFTTYVALGDSYTAGYTDGALGRRGQESSFPNIIAGQLATVGNNGFTQPLVKSSGSVGSAGLGYLDLEIAGQSLLPVPGAGDMAIFAERVYDASAPVHNLGVPGATAASLLAPAAGGNPFFSRFSSNQTTSVVIDALVQDPTFVSLWIGINDVLGFALGGGENGAPTSPLQFANSMGTIVSQLFTDTGTKGVIATIPDIKDLPYFDAISYDALEIDQTTADLLNAAYTQYNAVSVAMGLPKIEFVAGKNAFVIADKDYAHLGKIRQIKKDEKILLPALGYIRNTETGWGSKTPIPVEYVLDAEEVDKINSATEAYYETIKSIANQYGLAFVDLNSVMKEISEKTVSEDKGVAMDGNKYSSTFVSGGLFSLDGVHFTARGSAIIANEFIKAINKQYNANIPQAPINSYGTVTYP